MAVHEPLGESLGRFELGGLAVGAPDAQAVAAEQVDDAQGQGVVRAHDGQVGPVLLGKGQQAGKVVGGQGDVLDGDAAGRQALEGRSRVARGAPEALGVRRLGQFPHQRVFATA